MRVVMWWPQRDSNPCFSPVTFSSAILACLEVEVLEEATEIQHAARRGADTTGCSLSEGTAP